ncbi:uncharacterized protein LOC142072199 [Caretta caretta]|uniref:uncharacterized protein LOC142072199 n=1 Tax=Caretta caretta TaxID=8467 RepID=UPI003F4B600E
MLFGLVSIGRWQNAKPRYIESKVSFMSTWQGRASLLLSSCSLKSLRPSSPLFPPVPSMLSGRSQIRASLPKALPVSVGASESFMDFTNRLHEAILRQVDSPAAAQEILLKMAVENANEDCRRALQAAQASGVLELLDMLRACQNIGTQAHKAGVLAAALRKSGKEGKRCYRCGLVDTGADVTVIRDPEWPDRCGFWPGVCDRH